MSDNADSGDAPIINDAITADDAGFSSNHQGSVGESEIQAAPEAVEQLEEQVEQAIEEGASKEEIKQMIEEFEIKVNGKTIKKKIDLNDKKELQRQLQLAEVSQMSMQQKRELEKGIEEEVRRLMKDPRAVLREMGLDPNKLAEDWLTEEVNELKKSPEQVERERMEKELNELRSVLKKQKEDQEQSKMLQLQEQEGVKLRSEIEDALKAHKSLPDTSKTRARIADALLFAIENAEKLGIDASKVRVEDVIPTVEAEIKQELEGFLGELPEEMFEAYGVKKAIDRARKKKLDSIKAAGLGSVKPTTSSVDNSAKPSESQKIKIRDYFRTLGK